MMDHKARQNLAAAEVLIAQGFFDSTASRAYYAVYLAGWSWLTGAGKEPYEGHWAHRAMPKLLHDFEALGDDQREDMKFLYTQRVKADYYKDAIEQAEAQETLSIARALLDELLETE
jgi:uncharacterized protein (UPF0332 family)